jgi:hypothetical protein
MALMWTAAGLIVAKGEADYQEKASTDFHLPS